MARLTLQSDLVDELGSRIVDGRYAAGDMLLTEEIEHEFDLSRTVVREAIKVLESMHLIGIRRAIGITILDRSQWSVFDPRVISWRLAGPDRDGQLASLSDLRVAVEPVAAANFARTADEAQRQSLRSITDGLRDAHAARDMASFVDFDVAFHALLLEGSGNEMFAALSQVVSAMLRSRPDEQATPRFDQDRYDTLGPHLLLAEHIVAGDGTAAEEAARRVLARAREELGWAPSAGRLHGTSSSR
jgi:DNA-binding FadR family transcriptional regulator